MMKEKSIVIKTNLILVTIKFFKILFLRYNTLLSTYIYIYT